MSAYCDRDDLPKYGIGAVAIAPIPDDVKDAAIEGVSSSIDSYLRDRYQLPLTAWGIDIRRCAAILATYDLMVVRGYNPAAGADQNILTRYEGQIRWLERIARQEVQPDVTPTQDQAPGFDDPRVMTNAPRGWSRKRTVGLV